MNALSSANEPPVSPFRRRASLKPRVPHERNADRAPIYKIDRECIFREDDILCPRSLCFNY